MSEGLHLSDPELAIVNAILTQLLPPGYRVFAFGSRASGLQLKPWSDLDLLIEGPEPLPTEIAGRLREAFDESPLPWKVDLVERSGIGGQFAAAADRTKRSLDPAG